MRKLLLTTLMLVVLTGTTTLAAAAPATLTKEAAIEALKDIQGEVLAVDPSEIPGLYLVSVKMQGRNIPLYLDASGTYMISGNVIDLKQRRNLTEDLFRRLNPVDVSAIPLDDALPLGNPQAQQQVIVFTDPLCPFCSQLHTVLYQALEKNPNLLFQMVLLPMQPNSQRISQTILCNKSLEQLELAFAGKALPEPSCDSDTLRQNQALAQSLQITGTPTLILPNGQIHAGYRPVDDLLKLINENSLPVN
ncbi:MAG: DsbC family protein [Desulfuromonadales bacterium]|nr:DsbC family protein [Desulfuromonadales bacterium]